MSLNPFTTCHRSAVQGVTASYCQLFSLFVATKVEDVNATHDDSERVCEWESLPVCSESCVYLSAPRDG